MTMSDDELVEGLDYPGVDENGRTWVIGGNGDVQYLVGAETVETWDQFAAEIDAVDPERRVERIKEVARGLDLSHDGTRRAYQDALAEAMEDFSGLEKYDAWMARGGEGE
jgi:hypothetical protein